MPKSGQLRIIAGRYRGRRITVTDHESLRPTGDKIRETVFNWLGPQIIDSNCLDLFAGSGALGLESMSRGAKKVTFIEQSHKVFHSLKETISLFEESSLDLQHQNAEQFLKNHDYPFDIIFLDPPFHATDYKKLLLILLNSNCLSENTLVYIESNKPLETILLDHFDIIKEKNHGQVYFGLIRKINSL